MLYMMLVFGHVLAVSMALGAIVATDLRLLSKLAHDKVRIPPPNEFVARLVSVALVLLYATGAGMVVMGMREHPDYLMNEKLQGKLLLVLLLTINAFVLHRFTFPRLGRGRSLARWHFVDWLVVVPPVALSNTLWMFCAFLGTARPWSHAIPLHQVLEIAAGLYAFALVVVICVLAAAARQSPKDRPGAFIAVLKRWLASVGRLGKDTELRRDAAPHRSRSAEPPLSRYPAGVVPLAPTRSVVLRGSWPGSAPRRRA